MDLQVNKQVFNKNILQLKFKIMKISRILKTLIFVAFMFVSFQMSFAQKQPTKKVLTKIWNCSKVEIQCGKTFRNSFKRIYIESTAGSGNFKNEKIVVKDANGNVISTSPELITSTKYTSAPYNLKGGETYTITIIDGSGNIHKNNNGQVNSYTITAPKCGLEKEIGKKDQKINPSVIKKE